MQTRRPGFTSGAFQAWARDFARRSRVSVRPSFGSRFCGASAAVATIVSTSPDFLTTSHTSSAMSAFWSQPLDMPAVIPTTGSDANSETDRTPNHALQRTAPRVTVAAISGLDPSRPSVALSYARSLSLRPSTQLPRRAPQSLSLGSLGASSTSPMNEAF